MAVKSSLRLCRRSHRVAGTTERSSETLTPGGKYISIAGSDRAANDRVVFGQRSFHLASALRPLARRTLDVSEQDNHGARRQIGNGKRCPQRRQRCEPQVLSRAGEI
jgi:hypothetical protein